MFVYISKWINWFQLFVYILGASLIGTVLNADPVGNAKFVINQVNPLNSNPLNGLAVIGDTFNDIMSAPQTMKNLIKRIRRTD